MPQEKKTVCKVQSARGMLRMSHSKATTFGGPLPSAADLALSGIQGNRKSCNRSTLPMRKLERNGRLRSSCDIRSPPICTKVTAEMTRADNDLSSPPSLDAVLFTER